MTAHKIAYEDLRKWDKRFLSLACMVSTWSKDPDKKVGAVVSVSNSIKHLSVGFNGFPTPIEDTEERLLNKTVKNSLVIHAEVNALLNMPHQLEDRKLTLYVTEHPCLQCAIHLLQSNVERIIYYSPSKHSSWLDNYRKASTVLLEGGVKLTEVV